MIDVSFLYSGVRSNSVGHRYGRGRDLRGEELIAKKGTDRKPVIAWNVTRACNLKCAHCYSNSDQRVAADELTSAQALKVIDDLADFGVPVILFSGGEPLLRPDLFELIARAKSRGIKCVLSTNGTLINSEMADRIGMADVDYVGVSLDSASAAAHDKFRGVQGAWSRTLNGVRELKLRDQKVGLRITLTREMLGGVEAMFDLIERENIDRVCFYHLVPAGRGANETVCSVAEIRSAIETILSRTQKIIDSGNHIEVLTVDNHCDGAFIYLKLKERGDVRADEVLSMLKWNGGAEGSSGVGIACVDWAGRVHPDQFWMDYTLGNLCEKSFGEIWRDSDDQLLKKLRNRREFITGRCKACRFFDICGGGLRVRAKNLAADAWASDPACYLTDAEI